MNPEEAVEAAAKAAAKDEDASNWHDESEYYRNGWRNRMQVGLEAAAPIMLAKVTAEVDYYKARAAYFKYVPEVENDPEGVQNLREEMRAARKEFLGKETP